MTWRAIFVLPERASGKAVLATSKTRKARHIANHDQIGRVSSRPGLSPKRESQGDCKMLGGLSLRHRVMVATAAAVLMGSFASEPVKAADLGGDCCADLEERV